MFGLTPEQITTIAGIAGIISAVIAAIGVPLALRAWRDHLVGDLANAVIRERLADALTTPSLARLYERSLRTGLDRLESWMGGYGDLARGYRWCTAVAMGYAAFFILVSWALTDQGTGFGDYAIVAQTNLPLWSRVSAIFSLVFAGILASLAVKFWDDIDHLVRARAVRLIYRDAKNTELQASKTYNSIIVAFIILLISILYQIVWGFAGNNAISIMLILLAVFVIFEGSISFLIILISYLVLLVVAIYPGIDSLPISLAIFLSILPLHKLQAA